MSELNAKFDRVYLHEDSADSPLARRIYNIFPEAKIEIVRDKPLIGREGELSAREFAASKRLLYVCRFAGRFFKRCPGSRPGLACCNYFVLNWGVQCDMNCSYCYLQSFINSPVLTIYSNLADALEELRAIGPDLAAQNLRVGTGETVDSLSLDELTLYSHQLIDFFSKFPKWTLEFKTKSAKVDQFLAVPHSGNVVVSWSVNPQNIITHEEHGTASLAERLEAAEKCLRHGFKIAFHIDPMIWHPEWRANYKLLVQEITSRFTPLQVPYLSIGALRFQPEQRAMMRERFGMKSYVTSAETFAGTDGKLRYDANLRKEMFQFLNAEFKAQSEEWRAFLCMENKETWLSTMGASPFKDENLHDLFDPAVTRAFKTPAAKRPQDFR